tara:strand:- start:746 stop:1246 length:501 start_codon:yes stop_codon:yes gene_type:complete
MSKFNKKTRQKMVDDYLNDTGRNTFKADEFVLWLETQPDHPAYAAFHGRDDELLWQAKLNLARQLASGLRIVVKSEIIESATPSFKVTEYPAYISPVASRKLGGGYQAFDPDDPKSQEELRKQAGVYLAGWLSRYRGCAEHIGVDLKPIEDIVRVLRDDKTKEEVA